LEKRLKSAGKIEPFTLSTAFIVEKSFKQSKLIELNTVTIDVNKLPVEQEETTLLIALVLLVERLFVLTNIIKL